MGKTKSVTTAVKDTQAVSVLECVVKPDDEWMVCLGQHGLLSHDVFALLLLQYELLVTHLDCNNRNDKRKKTHQCS